MTLLYGPPPSRTDRVDLVTGVIVTVTGLSGGVVFLYWLLS
jgi:hypothetical protein